MHVTQVIETGGVPSLSVAWGRVSDVEPQRPPRRRIHPITRQSPIGVPGPGEWEPADHAIPVAHGHTAILQPARAIFRYSSWLAPCSL